MITYLKIKKNIFRKQRYLILFLVLFLSVILAFVYKKFNCVFENKIAFLIHKSIFKAFLNRKITFKSEEDPDNSFYLLSQGYRDFSTKYIESAFGFVLNLAVVLSTIALSLNNVVPLSIVILVLIHFYLFNNHIVHLFNIVSDLGQFKRL